MTVITEANKTKARELTAQLTLDEKIAIVHAAGLFRNGNAERLGIPPLRMDDGPMGVRAELHNDNWAPLYNTRDYVTYLPSGSAVASTWNPDLARMTGEVLGEEARGRGKDVILGPSINIKRSPLCGRNFEYMSEDPVLTAAQGVAYIQGVQESDVAACAKHYAVNSQETDRLDVDETVSERALREIYLPAFEAAVQDGGVLSVMGAYNLVNGTKCCEHKQLLDDILRDEYGFDGFVVSDWSAVRDTKASAEVGMDIELSVTPNFDDYYFANPLKKAVEDGDVKESDVDGKVERVIAVMDALHMLGDAHASRKPRPLRDARPRGEGIGHRPRIHRAAEKRRAPAAARRTQHDPSAGHRCQRRPHPLQRRRLGRHQSAARSIPAARPQRRARRQRRNRIRARLRRQTDQPGRKLAGGKP